jgi:1-acyl-sn-glycerol-3-phosphate acyltransferase
MLPERGTEVLSVLVLVCLAVAPLVIGWLKARRTRFTLAQWPLIIFCHLICRLMWGLRIKGRIPVERLNGAVLVANHRSPFDPWFIEVSLDRVVHWMVAGEYFTAGVFGWALRTVEAIPTRRGGVDTASTKQAIAYAARGELVGLLPEGRINVSDEFMLPARPGVALVALRARVPVIPCYIEGAPYDGSVLGTFLCPARVRLTIGEPIDLSAYYDRDDDKNLQGELMKRFILEIARLAGKSDYVPQLAGKKWKPDD